MGDTAGDGERSIDAVDSELSRLWSGILRIESVPADTDFFALGGDSLRAAALVAAVAERLRRHVPLSFFGDGQATLRRMEAVTANAAEISVRSEPISATPGATGPPAARASSAEQRVLLQSRLDRDGALYNVPLALHLRGPLDHARLQSALQCTVDRYDGLRTAFPLVDGIPVRDVRDAVAIRVPTTQTSPSSEALLLRDEARRPFDLEHGPLVRARLFRSGPEQHTLLLTIHHSVVDGVSRDILLTSLARAYARREPLVPPGNLARLVADEPGGAEPAAGRDYWLQQLSPLPEALALPVDRPRGLDRRWEGGRLHWTLDPRVASALRDFASERAVTPFMVVLAALDALLSRLTGATDVVVGAPAANRHRTAAAGVVGMLVNMLALRVDVSGDPSFDELVRRVRRVSLDAFAHQEYPFERMVEELHPARTGDVSPFFSVVLQVRTDAPDLSGFEPLEVSFEEVSTGTAKFDLEFALDEAPAGFSGMVEYSSELFDARTVDGIVGSLARVIEAALEDPSQPVSRLPVVDPVQEHELVRKGIGPAPQPPARTVLEMVEAQAARTPSALALIAGERSLTYAQLDAAVRRAASALLDAGVGRGDIVGVSLKRDAGMVVSLLAVLRAGAAYLPLDPTYPERRLQTMVGQAPLRLLLHSGERPRWLPPSVPAISVVQILAGEERSLPDVDPSDRAYVLFTSGSTGTPKAVSVQHASLVNLMSWTTRSFDPQELRRVLFGTSLNFDMSLLELFPPLAVGGCVVVAENILHIRDLPRELGITLLCTAPAALSILVASGAIPETVTTIISGGEVLTQALAARLLALPQHPRLVNIYGPTETTVMCAATDVTNSAALPPIGTPIDGAITLVMDRLGRIQPAGVPGELYIGGAVVGIGYLNDAALTESRFVQVDVAGMGTQRMYRTGDLVRSDEEGSLHFLRRMDDQLKVRGMRIEPGDVESVLVRHPGVGSAAVFAAGAGDDRGLHAAVTARADLDLEALRRFAAEELPQHMVPRRIVVMDVMPLNSSGKLDRKAVAATAQARAPDATVPAVTLDSTLLDIWQSLLGSRPVDPETDFYDAGGHSILALRLVTEVERRLGVSLPLSLFFEGDATVARISAEVRERVGGGPSGDAMRDRVPVVPQGTGPLMLPFSGERLGAPLFVVCPHAGAALATRRIASVIATERHPVFALSPQWDDSTILERVIDQMVIMVASDGRDRVHLAGHSLGGVVAYEMAGRLAQRGIEVGMLCLVDTVSPEMMRAHKPLLRRRIRVALGIPVFWRRMPPPAPPGEAWELGAYGFPFDRASALVRRHRVRPQNRRIDLLVTETSTQRFGDSLGWEQVHQGPIVRTPIPGDHVGVMRPPHVTALARILAERIRCAELPPAT